MSISKDLTEEDVKFRYINEAITSKGWSKDSIFMEQKVKFTDGKISLHGNLVHREKPKFAYSSNGEGFAEHDFLTGKERTFTMEEFLCKLNN